MKDSKEPEPGIMKLLCPTGDSENKDEPKTKREKMPKGEDRQPKAERTIERNEGERRGGR